MKWIDENQTNQQFCFLKHETITTDIQIINERLKNLKLMFNRITKNQIICKLCETYYVSRVISCGHIVCSRCLIMLLQNQSLDDLDKNLTLNILHDKDNNYLDLEIESLFYKHNMSIKCPFCQINYETLPIKIKH